MSQLSLESVKMLQYRAALEEKLKRKGVSGSHASKTDRSKKQKLNRLTGWLETIYDFDDDAMDVNGTSTTNGRSSTPSSKLSKLITGKNDVQKGVSGDDDVPERDDLGKRRWKHERRAGIKTNNKDSKPENKPKSHGNHEAQVEGDHESNDESDRSEDEFYKQIKQQVAAKRAFKSDKYSRNSQFLSEPETTINGKRHITPQMECNRGLTRNRKKSIKNPRKNNKRKYENAVKCRKGQVREIKKASGPYGGELGINTQISHSVRFKG